MQIISVLFLLPVAALSFGLSRRDACFGAIAFGVGTTTPEIANAFSQQLDDYIVEPAQQATDGKLDLNAAFVGEYTKLRGMYPHAAGKIASNGPFYSVKDIYRIPGLTDNDKKMFKLYEREFTVNPPGRAFKERINARVST
mmetsp:Transcript_14142/g.21590  ORF Transcript_14142/g.21590 Transcript_14142/m.21590 type:complete len:141 (-) Transcript_14142:82-504(-)|eukprot:CAMPEP_0178904568 /NCGR_PEP_ID=MMETSP0786-20121207/5773_1 /TAXON_ID=186022 /ORGANISM="Thalassionema frauenfeldii, Strain CCMP 1798" /LENGTH=140 /DNA_ID=CAMNT_0020576041 /DNA_START=104 /DNA_END=526 /DNA_ORIENTATION=+